MTRKTALYLIGYMLWSFFVWITLVKNIAHDHLPTHGTAFHVVHYVLAAVSLVLAAGVGYVGFRGLRPATPVALGQRESDSPSLR